MLISTNGTVEIAKKWKIESLNNGYFKITAKHSGRVFDIANASKANSANLKQYDWHGGDNQQWKLEAISGGTTTSGGGTGVLETVKVLGASKAKVYSNTILQNGKTYTLQISGVFSLWSISDPTGVDALYNFRGSLANNPKLWSNLHIDDKPLINYLKETGGNSAYNQNHIYQLTFTGKGSRLGLVLSEGGSYSDNSGEISVQIIGN